VTIAHHSYCWRSPTGLRNLLRLAAEGIDCTPTSIDRRLGLATADSPRFDLPPPASLFYSRQSCLMAMLSSSCPEYCMTVHLASLFDYRQSGLAPRLSPAWPVMFASSDWSRQSPTANLTSIFDYRHPCPMILGPSICSHHSMIVIPVSLFYDHEHSLIIRQLPHYSTTVSLASAFCRRQPGLTIPLSSIRSHRSAIVDPASVCW
jgi:hypothetical protein